MKGTSRRRSRQQMSYWDLREAAASDRRAMTHSFTSISLIYAMALKRSRTPFEDTHRGTWLVSTRWDMHAMCRCDPRQHAREPARSLRFRGQSAYARMRIAWPTGPWKCIKTKRFPCFPFPLRKLGELTPILANCLGEKERERESRDLNYSDNRALNTRRVSTFDIAHRSGLLLSRNLRDQACY